MKRYFAYTSIVTALLFSACNNGSSSNTADTHEGHDHTSHPHTAAPTQPAQTAPQQIANNEPIAAIPEFKFYKLKSGFGFEKADIPKGKNTVFILFDPSCSHCQMETQALAKNYDKVKDINIFYVSMNDPGLMANFLPSFGKELDGKPNVEILYDRDQEFIRKFHIPNIFPANYVYDQNGQLKTYWEGEKAIEDVLTAFTK